MQFTTSYRRGSEFACCPWIVEGCLYLPDNSMVAASLWADTWDELQKEVLPALRREAQATLDRWEEDNIPWHPRQITLANG